MVWAAVLLAMVGWAADGCVVSESDNGELAKAPEALQLLPPNLAAATGADSNLQVLGVNAMNTLVLSDRQNATTGAWTAGFPFGTGGAGGGGGSGFSTPPATGIVADLGITAAGGNRVTSSLFVFGLKTADGSATILTTQIGSIWTGGSSPFGSGAYLALATGHSSTGNLNLIGLQADHFAAVVGAQDASGGWHLRGALPGQTAMLSAIAAGRGGSNLLQVVGLGISDKKAYLAGWQDSGGVWQSGFILPGQTAQMSQIAVGNGNGGQLQVLGLGPSGQVYLVNWQDTSGNWHGGFQLPSVNQSFSSIAAARGADGHLQVFGIVGNTGLPMLAAWQDANGNWFAGGPLPNPGQPMARIAVAPGANGSVQVVGIGGADSQTYVAFWQDPSGAWHGGSVLP
jgi:hypothetical protein